MDEDDPDWERAKAAAEFFRRRYEEELLDRAEAVLEAMGPSSDVPMPNTSHPAYAGYMIDFDKAGAGIRIRIMNRLSATCFLEKETSPRPETEVGFNTYTLTRKHCVGPAPFVGDPLWERGQYHWDYFVDNYGRHIAGDCTLNIEPRTTRVY